MKQVGMLYIAEAFAYYAKHINREERFRLLREHNLRVAGSIHPIDWELFGSILTGDQGRQGYGSDLNEHEVKSAAIGSSFEHQTISKVAQRSFKKTRLCNIFSYRTPLTTKILSSEWRQAPHWQIFSQLGSLYLRRIIVVRFDVSDSAEALHTVRSLPKVVS